MKLITLLIAYLPFCFVFASPAHFLGDVAAATKPKWALFKRAGDPNDLNDRIDSDWLDSRGKRHRLSREFREPNPSERSWNAPNRLSEPIPIPPHPLPRSDTLSSSDSEASFSPSESSSMSSSPSPPRDLPRYARQPDHVHGDGHYTHPRWHREIAGWVPSAKEWWMRESPFRWGDDRGTKTFLTEGNLQRSFDWHKGVCDLLGDLNCRKGVITMKRYPGRNPEHPYYAEVSELDPPIRASGNRRFRVATVDHRGKVRVPPQQGDVPFEWRPVFQEEVARRPYMRHWDRDLERTRLGPRTRS